MLRRHTSLLTLTLLAAFSLAAAPAGAVPVPLVIDNFTSQTDLLGNPLLALLGGGGTIGEIQGNLVLEQTANASISGTASWTTSDFDLSFDSSTNDNYFEIYVTNLVGTTWEAQITLGDGNGPVVSSGFQDIATSGQAYIFPFASFGGIDFASIDSVVLEVKNGSAQGDTISIDFLQVVPEPGSAALLTLGLFGLAAGTPRRRIAA